MPYCPKFTLKESNAPLKILKNYVCSYEVLRIGTLKKYFSELLQYER